MAIEWATLLLIITTITLKSLEAKGQGVNDRVTYGSVSFREGDTSLIIAPPFVT